MRQQVIFATAVFLLAASVSPQDVWGQPLVPLPPGAVLPKPDRTQVAERIRNFSSADEMISGVDLVIVATAGTAATGRTVKHRDGSPPVGFELVPLVVNEILRARPPVGVDIGSTIRLERLADALSERGERTIADYDLGPLVPGKRYVLFLDRQPAPPFAFLQVTDQARYELDADEVLVSAADGLVAK